MQSAITDPRIAAIRLQAWIEGSVADPSNPGLIDALVRGDATRKDVATLGLHPDAILFAPQDLAEELELGTLATVIGYSGEFADTGTEIAIGDDLLVQFESYSTVEYVTMVCPTCVTITDQVDLEVLRADVQRAQADGVFPPHLTSALVTFAGLAEILGLNPTTESRLSTAFRHEISGETGVATRRYVAALRALQLASSRVDGDLRVSGFGPAIMSEPGRHAIANAPFVLQSQDAAYYLADVRRNRFGRVEPAVAQAVESVVDGRTPPFDALDALGVSRWGSSSAEALFDRLGLELPGMGSASDRG